MDIYVIECKENGKKYIGSTTRDWATRWQEHQRNMRGGYHTNPVLQSAWNVHGEEAFECQLLVSLDTDDVEALVEREQQLINEHGCMAPDGFNLKDAGHAGSPGAETRRKMSESRQGANNPYYGRTHSPETRARISEAIRGRPCPEWKKQLMSERMSGENNSFYGKTHSEETKQKIREANTGLTLTDEQKQKISDYHKGREKSPETKRKMAEAARQRWERIKADKEKYEEIRAAMSAGCQNRNK